MEKALERKDRQFKALVTIHTETFALSASLWKYGEPKVEVGTLCGEHGVSAFFIFSHLFTFLIFSA